MRRVRRSRRRMRERVKAIEQHDQSRRQGRRVLAEGAFRRRRPRSRASSEFIHFACTSEDINNLAHGLMLVESRRDDPAARADAISRRRCARSRTRTPMWRCWRARTASRRRRPRSARKWPTCYARLERQIAAIEHVPIKGKMNGAVGNYNAHVAAYPDVDWERLAAKVVHTARPRVQSVHDADRAARLHGRAVRRDCARQHRPHRPRPRRMGLHLARLFPATDERRARSAPRRCRTRSIRSTSRTPRAISASPTRCCDTWRRSCRSRASSATSPTRRCCATWASRSATRCSAGFRCARAPPARRRRSAHRRRSRRQLGSPGRADPDGDAPLRAPQPVRAAEGAHARRNRE